MKKYDFELTMNTRDLGGYKTKYHRKTKYLRFIRSDALTYITENEKNFLIDNNVTLVIDFRTPNVVNKIPSPFVNDKRFEYYNYPLVEGSGIPLNDNNASELYFKMIHNYSTYNEVFNLIANSKKNVIFNCTAGKDRTGIFACLLLLLAGVSKKDILNDYEISTKFIYSSINKIRMHNENFPKDLGVSKRLYLENFLKMFFDEYKSIENYLTIIGLSQKTIKKIRNKLIGDDYDE